MTGGKLEVAYVFIQMAAVIILLIVCGLFVCKVVNLYNQRLKSKCDKKNGAYFEKIQNLLGQDGDGTLPKPEGKLNRVERNVIQSKLTGWIGQMDGLAREKLIVLCEELGFVDRELVRLQSRFSIRKTKAAYRLGMLRSKRAAPALLEELKKQTFDPSLFIFARSLALCARGTDDLESMVKQIIKHRKPVHDITAAIMEELGGDLSEVLERLLLSGNPDMKLIASLSVDRKTTIRESSSSNVLVFRELSDTEGQQPKTHVI